jgi:two-component sensor histidine kinase
MALIHEILYQSRDLSRIDFSEYIKILLGQLFHSYGAYSKDLTYECDVKDIMLDVDSAIPCGLIINELVSNSLSHAFPDGRRGYIRVGFSIDESHDLTLIIHDNGIGIPKGVDFRHTDSLGLKLVMALTNQLAGVVELDIANGTTFKITFRDAKHKERKYDHGTSTDHGG